MILSITRNHWRRDGNNTDSHPEKTDAAQPANSQLEEITLQANTENDNLLNALPKETSCTAPSVSLSQSLEQTTAMPSCSSSSSDMAHAKKDRRVASYCRATTPRAPGKTCASFSWISSPGVPYITKAGIFGDHCSRRSTGHLESQRHKEAVKNKQSHNTLACKCTNVCKMLCEASLTLK